jgi:hypothetical protein
MSNRTLYTLLTLFMQVTFDQPTASIEQTDNGAISDLLDKNALTTAGVALAAGTTVAGGMVLTAALPVQMIGLAAVSGSLIYAGDRQAKGLSINPLAMSKAPVMSDDRDLTEATTVVAKAA